MKKRICVFCGSNPGKVPIYTDVSRTLGRAIAKRGFGLVFGGSNLGLMKAVSDAALEEGGTVIGVITEQLAAKEIAHQGLTELRVVSTMSQRKEVMRELSSAFVALPGGFGTLDELFEELTQAQLGLHQKPCGLLDVMGYYAGLGGLLDTAVAERFLKKEHRSMLIIENDVERLLNEIENFRSPQIDKWMDIAV